MEDIPVNEKGEYPDHGHLITYQDLELRERAKNLYTKIGSPLGTDESQFKEWVLWHMTYQQMGEM